MAWLSNKKDRNVITYHPGVYKFSWPYLSSSLVADKYNNVQIYTCEIEIHVGREDDLKLRRMATVYIKASKEGLGITNYFEDIATKIRISFFDYIFNEHLMDEDILTERIRWVEYYPREFYPSVFPNGSYKEVKMEWDSKKRSYNNPSWFEMTDDYVIFEIPEPQIQQGDIYMAEFSLPSFSLQTQIRPVVILTRNNTLQTIAAPISSSRNIQMISTHVLINADNSGLTRDSIILVEQARAIEKVHLKYKIGTLSKQHVDKVLNAWKSLALIDDQSQEITPTNKKFVMGDIIDFEEDIIHEFKDFSKSGNVIKTIVNCVDEYVCSFLNSKGGRIFFGIDNNQKVIGLKLSYQDRDDLKCSISSKLYNMLPSVDPTAYQLYFHNVFSNNKLNNELFIIELIVPKPVDESTLHFTGGNDAFVRVNGLKKKLNGLEIQDWIKRRINK